MGINEWSLLIFIICAGLYSSLLIYSIRCKKSQHKSSIRALYQNWVSVQIHDREKLTTIQTLRNIITANSIFISALLLLLGIIIGLYNGGYFNQTDLFWGIEKLTTNLVQFATILFLTILCLYNFISAVRMINRFTILFSGISKDVDDSAIVGKDLMNQAFISAQNHWMFGIRGLFYLVPTLFWLVNPVFFIIVTIAVTLFFIGFRDIWVFTSKFANL